MLSRIPKSIAVTTLAGALMLVLGAQSAWAFGDEATPFIITIMQTSLEQLAQAQNTLATLRKSYDAAKTVVQYADDARQAYQSFRTYNIKLFAQDIEQSFELAYPDAAYLRREASRTGPWAEGTGELQHLLGLCLSNALSDRPGVPSCNTLTERITLAQARDSIAKTFGGVPPVAGAVETHAVDHESARAISGADTQLGRDLKTAATSDSLLPRCEDSSDDSGAECQAAANTAAIRQLKATADLTDQVAELRRVEGVRLAQENMRRKRELSEAMERRQADVDSKQWLDAVPASVKTDGLTF